MNILVKPKLTSQYELMYDTLIIYQGIVVEVRKNSDDIKSLYIHTTTMLDKIPSHVNVLNIEWLISDKQYGPHEKHS